MLKSLDTPIHRIANLHNVPRIAEGVASGSNRARFAFRRQSRQLIFTHEGTKRAKVEFSPLVHLFVPRFTPDP